MERGRGDKGCEFPLENVRKFIPIILAEIFPGSYYTVGFVVLKITNEILRATILIINNSDIAFVINCAHRRFMQCMFPGGKFLEISGIIILILNFRKI